MGASVKKNRTKPRPAAQVAKPEWVRIHHNTADMIVSVLQEVPCTFGFRTKALAQTW